MKYERYSIESSTSLLKFEFYSEGPKGRVRKQVLFKAFKENPKVFNLGFGDVNIDGEINDTVITGNDDSRKVLTTVALTVYKFFEKYNDCFVYATGSSKARTRLYRIGIANNLEEIMDDFEIFGFINNRWEKFEKGKDYEAFLIRKRN